MPLPNFARGAKRKKRVRPKRVEPPPDKTPKIDPDEPRVRPLDSTFDDRIEEGSQEEEKRNDMDREVPPDEVPIPDDDDHIDMDLRWEGGNLEEEGH